MSKSSFLKTYNASAVAGASAQTKSGQLVTASASATASSTLSYEDAYNIALENAKSIALQNAIHDVNVIESNECCLETFYASANADAAVNANNGQLVTASAQATASSTLNYEDAYDIANDNAKSIAKHTAENDANIINQSFPGVIVLENLASSNNVYNIHDNSNYTYIKGSSGNSTNLPPIFAPIYSSITNTNVIVSAVDSKGNLYVGGSFIQLTNSTGYTTLNGYDTIFNNVAMWDGSKWSTLGNGLGGIVNAISIDNNDNVYFGGAFTYLGDYTTSANYIAKWTPGTSTWSVLGDSTSNGLGGNVNALACDKNNNVYVGGDFTTLGDVTIPASRIAKWRPSAAGSPTSGSWSSLGGGLNNSVYSLAVDSTDGVYVGGVFTSYFNAPGTAAVPVNRIVKWLPNGAGSWSALYISIAAGTNGVLAGTAAGAIVVYALAIDSTDSVYVGGNFKALGDGRVSNYIAKWAPTSSTTGNWSVLTTGTSNGVNNTVYALAIDSSNNVYIGGIFTSINNSSGGIVVSNIAKWNLSTTSFSSVGGVFYDYYNSAFGKNGIPISSESIILNVAQGYLYQLIIPLQSTTINSIAINKSSNNIYAINVSNGVYQLLTDYVSLKYDGILLRYLWINGQSSCYYTHNKDGKKICNLITDVNAYQNYYN